MPKVFIRNSALVSLIVSSIEVFKKETFGILLGKKQKKDFIVKQAINFQSATRHYDYVAIDKMRENRMNNSLKFITVDKFIGDFHSHSGNYENPSKHDIQDMKEQGPGKVFILIVVKNAKRNFEWIYNSREKSISGSIGKKFFVKIFAFHINEKSEKHEKLIIRAPLIKKLNSFAKHWNKIETKLKKIEKESLKKEFVKKKLKAKLKSY